MKHNISVMLSVTQGENNNNNKEKQQMLNRLTIRNLEEQQILKWLTIRNIVVTWSRYMYTHSVAVQKGCKLNKSLDEQ